MKVLILGGYGVFGGRLARLLLEDGGEIIVAGRNLKRAAAFARQYGGTPLCIDIAKDLLPIAKAAPNIVVDAAGPFQTYGDDPYRVPRFCLEHKINYLDLSDDAGFTAGITALNAQAIAAGCFALSGVSSVPAISASAVAFLGEGLSEILLIETALVPGNRAPRGRSVVGSILAQAGEPLMVWRGGAWREYNGWTGAKRVVFGPGFRRWASLIGAPDLKLFPQAFNARSVVFRAGLELSLMHWGLAIFGRLRAFRLLPSLTVFLEPILWISERLKPFGSDRGGMAVEVTGFKDGKAMRRRWQVIANAGDGPFIPAIPARAIVRKTDAVKPGARPCHWDLTLQEIEGTMAGLAVEFAASEAEAPTLFQRVLGERWQDLPASVRRLHSVQDLESFSGKARVVRGSGGLARGAAWLFNLPPAGEDLPLTVTKERMGEGEIWQRSFAGRRFRSGLSPSRRAFCIKERFGAVSFELQLSVDGGSLRFPVCRGWFCGIPLPARLLPKSESREYEENGAFHFDVALYAPLTGELIVRYQGHAAPHCDAENRQAEDCPARRGAPVSD